MRLSNLKFINSKLLHPIFLPNLRSNIAKSNSTLLWPNYELFKHAFQNVKILNAHTKRGGTLSAKYNSSKELQQQLYLSGYDIIHESTKLLTTHNNGSKINGFFKTNLFCQIGVFLN